MCCMAKRTAPAERHVSRARAHCRVPLPWPVWAQGLDPRALAAQQDSLLATPSVVRDPRPGWPAAQRHMQRSAAHLLAC
jgi:hypothetical protein